MGELQASMYGTRDAAFNWEAAYSSEMLKLGFLRGKASANHYFHPVTTVRALVHGDDFALVGLEKDLRGFEGDFRRLYPCTVSLIGPDKQHNKALKILGREIRYATTGIEMEVDTKYLKQALQAYGMEECHAAASPATKEEHEGHEDRRELLRRRVEEEGKAGIGKSEEANGRIRGARLSTSAETTFRSATALINFILPDRPGAMYAGKEVLRAMSEPGEEDLRRLKRLLRYLKGAARRAILFPWMELPDQDIEAEVDSDFAGCTITRRSTCGGVIR